MPWEAKTAVRPCCSCQCDVPTPGHGAAWRACGTNDAGWRGPRWSWWYVQKMRGYIPGTLCCVDVQLMCACVVVYCWVWIYRSSDLRQIDWGWPAMAHVFSPLQPSLEWRWICWGFVGGWTTTQSFRDYFISHAVIRFPIQLVGGFKYDTFSALLGEDEAILINILRMGWKHQLDRYLDVYRP